jgi:uncharacterized protein (TIGR02145 family)
MNQIGIITKCNINLNRECFNIVNYPLMVIGVLVFLVTGCRKTIENEPQVSSLSDIEGNSYKTVKIGTQWWMAENLKTTKFNDGTNIPLLESNDDFGYYITPAYCWYDNNSGYKNTYGALYNWYAVNTGMLCPTGWHVPTETEWSALIDFLGGENVAGGKLKSISSLWQYRNVGATNKSDFSVLPGGARGYSDPGYYRGVGFNSIGVATSLWSTTESEMLARGYWLSNDYESIQSFLATEGTGAYVRCLKDTSFTKSPGIPVLDTKAAISIASTIATCGGKIKNDGGATITNRGICWSTTSNPTVESGTKTSSGTGSGSFSSQITGLTAGTTYFVRAYAANSAGIGYGNQISFTTSSGQTGTVTDVEGNIYNTVSTGTQVWTIENLRTTKYNDGTDIPLITDNTSWAGLSTPGYCWYNNDPGTYKVNYGALYNWYAVSPAKNGGKNVCPIGWHLPSDDEWSILTTFWGGEYVAGGKLKETGTAHWAFPNEAATNESSFSALPGGFRNSSGFQSAGLSGCWWSSSTYFSSINGTTNALSRVLGNSYNYVFRNKFGISMKFGYSVRCLKD